MAQSTDTQSTIDLLALLEHQNHYQRLGLRTNAVTTEQIEVAYAKRMRLLGECHAEVTAEITAAAAQMIGEAHATLRDDKARREYDQALERAARWKGNLKPAVAPQNASSPGGSCNRDGQNLLLGRYQIGKVLYEGQRSTIYDAVDTRFDRSVVIKRMLFALSKTPDYLNQFQEEAGQFARFTSGHLVKVLDYDAKTASIVMEKLQHDLRELVKPKGLDWKRAFAILADCLEGLCELHAAGMSHARIDLSHVMLDTHGGAKLTLTPGMRRGSQSLLPGAQSRHLAPELLNPEVFGEPGPNADIYSLGFVVLELLVGTALPERVSKAIRVSDEDPTAWLQWHASPTDHLPDLESLIPSVPAAYVEVLGRMTNKQQHERFSSAAECLQTLREMQGAFATGPKPVEQSLCNQEATEAVDLLGQPAPLHGRYELPAKLTWMDILRNPSSIFQEDASQHRMALLSVGALAALLLIVLGMQSSSDESGTAALASEVAAAPEEEGLNLSRYVTDEVQEQEEPVPTSTEPPADDIPQTPAINATQHRRVTFTVKPRGDVVQVEPLGGGTMESVVAADSSGTWSLSAGQYSVRYELAENATQETANITVPSGTADLNFILQVTQVESEVPPAPAAPVVAARELPSVFSRPEMLFSVIPSRNMTAPELAEHMRKYLKDFPYRKRSSTPDLQARARAKGVRDPRVSFIYALQAEHEGKHELAIEQCVRALREAEHFNVPFILPLELLCQLELKRGGKGLSVAHSACRQTTEWIRNQGQIRKNREFDQALEYLAWWTGTVVGFIETTRSPDSLGKVDLEPSKILFRNQLTERHADLFDGAVQRVQRQHKSLLTGNRELSDFAWTQGISDQKRMLLYQQHEDYSSESEDPWDQPITAPAYADPYAYGASMLYPSDESDKRLELADESGSRIVDHIETQPRRPEGSWVSVSTFTHYASMDLNTMASETRKTIPVEPSPNARPARTIAAR